MNMVCKIKNGPKKKSRTSTKCSVHNMRKEYRFGDSRATAQSRQRPVHNESNGVCVAIHGLTTTTTVNVQGAR